MVLISLNWTKSDNQLVNEFLENTKYYRGNRHFNFVKDMEHLRDGVNWSIRDDVKILFKKLFFIVNHQILIRAEVTNSI